MHLDLAQGFLDITLLAGDGRRPHQGRRREVHAVHPELRPAGVGDDGAVGGATGLGGDVLADLAGEGQVGLLPRAPVEGQGGQGKGAPVPGGALGQVHALGELGVQPAAGALGVTLLAQGVGGLQQAQHENAVAPVAGELAGPVGAQGLIGHPAQQRFVRHTPLWNQSSSEETLRSAQGDITVILSGAKDLASGRLGALVSRCLL